MLILVQRGRYYLISGDIAGDMIRYEFCIRSINWLYNTEVTKIKELE